MALCDMVAGGAMDVMVGVAAGAGLRLAKRRS
jgi:hypothetical protein